MLPPIPRECITSGLGRDYMMRAGHRSDASGVHMILRRKRAYGRTHGIEHFCNVAGPLARWQSSHHGRTCQIRLSCCRRAPHRSEALQYLTTCRPGLCARLRAAGTASGECVRRVSLGGSSLVRQYTAFPSTGRGKGSRRPSLVPVDLQMGSLGRLLGSVRIAEKGVLGLALGSQSRRFYVLPR